MNNANCPINSYFCTYRSVQTSDLTREIQWTGLMQELTTGLNREHKCLECSAMSHCFPEDQRKRELKDCKLGLGDDLSNSLCWK